MLWSTWGYDCVRAHLTTNDAAAGNRTRNLSARSTSSYHYTTAPQTPNPTAVHTRFFQVFFSVSLILGGLKIFSKFHVHSRFTEVFTLDSVSTETSTVSLPLVFSSSKSPSQLGGLGVALTVGAASVSGPPGGARRDSVLVHLDALLFTKLSFPSSAYSCPLFRVRLLPTSQFLDYFRYLTRNFALKFVKNYHFLSHALLPFPPPSFSKCLLQVELTRRSCLSASLMTCGSSCCSRFTSLIRLSFCPRAARRGPVCNTRPRPV